MFSLPEPIEVCWRSKQPPSTSPLLRIHEPGNVEKPYDVLVRDVFPEINELGNEDSRQCIAAPTLLISDNNQIVTATQLLREGDDLCLVGSPWSLIEYRICRLHMNAARKNSQLTASKRRRELIMELKHHATTDSLTQVRNRRYLDRQLESDVQAAGCGSISLSVGLIDIDNFGDVNKAHGWPTGDRVLKQVCSIIKANIRSTDWVGRYGGEEFLVVLRNANLTNARRILERLRESVERTQFESTAGIPFHVTMSIGVAQQNAEHHSRQQLLESVSRQTLAAKTAGRNCLRP